MCIKSEAKFHCFGLPCLRILHGNRYKWYLLDNDDVDDDDDHDHDYDDENSYFAC